MKTNMNHTEKDQPMNHNTNPKRLLVLLRRPSVWLGSILGVVGGIALLANAQQPVLRISDLGTNQFSVLITNGISSTNYTLFWTPSLNDSNYPWTVVGVGSVGETNFLIDGGAWSVGFFRVLLGSDADGDGVPAWKDANDDDLNIGILSVTIDSPINGTVY